MAGGKWLCDPEEVGVDPEQDWAPCFLSLDPRGPCPQGVLKMGGSLGKSLASLESIPSPPPSEQAAVTGRDSGSQQHPEPK